MCPGIALLDEALELARQEKAALEGGEYEEAIGMAQKRSELTQMAWNYVDPKVKEPYRVRLTELDTLQRQLTLMATTARDVVRGRLNRSKQEKRRMNGYQMALGHAMQ